MVEQKATPSEEQVKAANEAEEAKWQGDFKEEDLTIPYKREADENAKDGTEKAEEKDGEGEEATPEEDAVEPQENYTEPAPVVTAEDPGEYKPADYSFNVTDKDGNTVTISTPEAADKFAADDDNFTTAKQLKDFIAKSQKMEIKLENDKEKWESKKKAFDDQKQVEADRLATLNTLSAEFDYLVSKKLLPTIDSKFKDADWSDPAVASQPGVKEQVELLNYMVKENEQRAKVGIRPLTSIVDAFNARRLELGEQKVDEDKKKAGEERKAAGARVAGVSASNQQPYIPKGIAVGNPNVFKQNQSVWDD